MNINSFTAQGLGQVVTTAKAPVISGQNELAALGNQVQKIGQEYAYQVAEDDVNAAQVEYIKGVAAIDEKYRNDTDYKTIRERRAKDIETLNESLVNGVGKIARERLQPVLNKRGAQDAVAFNTEVIHRESDLRIARFNANSDVLMNAVINARSDEEKEASMHTFTSSLDAMIPIVGQAQVIKMRDSMMDNINFMRVQRQIPEAVRKGIGFNPETYKTMNPSQVAQIEQKFKVEKAKLKAENLSFINDQLKDHNAIYRMEGRDDGLAAKAESLGLKEEAAQIRIGDKANKLLFDAETATPTGSLMGHYMAAEKRAMEELAGDANAYEREQVLKALSKDRATAIKQYTADPMQAAMNVQGMPYEGESTESYLDRVMATQQELGKGIPGVETTVLTDAQKNELMVRWEEGDANVKAQMLVEIQSTYGKYAPIALKQMKLDDSASYAVGVVETNPSKMHLLKESVDLADVKLNEMVPDSADRKTIKADAASTLADNDQWQVLENNINRFGNAAQRAWLSNQRTFFEKVYASRGKEGVEEYLNEFYGVEGKHGSYLTPKQYTGRAVDAGITQALKKVDAGKYVGIDASHPFYKEAVADLKEHGVIVNATPAVEAANKAEGVMLMNVKTNAPYKDKDGNVLFFSFDELKAMGEGDVAKYNILDFDFYE